MVQIAKNFLRNPRTGDILLRMDAPGSSFASRRIFNDSLVTYTLVTGSPIYVPVISTASVIPCLKAGPTFISAANSVYIGPDLTLASSGSTDPPTYRNHPPILTNGPVVLNFEYITARAGGNDISGGGPWTGPEISGWYARMAALGIIVNFDPQRQVGPQVK